MNEMSYTYLFDMATILLEQEETCGSLSMLSCRDSEDVSHLINEVIKTIITHMKEKTTVVKWYNIKIFVENPKLDNSYLPIPIFAECYNYLLMNTGFKSQRHFKKDIKFSFTVNTMPTLSPYLFLQIIWKLKCEDLLVESLVHIPMTLCKEILKLIIRNIDEMNTLRVRRFIFLLIYKLYYKCLWLRLDRLSMSDAIFCQNKLVKYFTKLCDSLIMKFDISHNLSTEQKYEQHGILVKNIVRYVKKCMHSKIESYSENHNLAKFFTLTYGDLCAEKYYKPLVTTIKSIILEFEEILAKLLLSQINNINYYEFEAWRLTDDDENNVISLQRAIVMECNYFIKFMNQNEFLVTNQNMSHCLEQLRLCIVDRGNSNESTVTLLEFCQNITRGRLCGVKELMKRYKEWDLSILNFIKDRINFLTVSDVIVTLEYLHYIFRRLPTKTEKYEYYISVLKILMQLTLENMIIVVKNYVEWHFDDNPLEFLYNEDCFTAFIERIESHDNDNQFRILLIFLLLNPRKVLTKFVMCEISNESVLNILFKANMSLVREFYRLHKGNFNILFYILKDIIAQRRVELNRRFLMFLDKILKLKMTYELPIIRYHYVGYLTDNTYNEEELRTILLHMLSIVKKNPVKNKFDTVLVIALCRTSFFLRRLKRFSRLTISNAISLIRHILSYLKLLRPGKNEKMIFKYNVHSTLFWTCDTIDLIKECEKRCFLVFRQLRIDPRCHLKLRNFIRTFNLDQETFLRHFILHCNIMEYQVHAYELTFKYFHHFCWPDKMTAYENIMRISADALQIALRYPEMFPEYMLPTSLISIVRYCKLIESNMLDNYVAIRHILLKTLSSLNSIMSRTTYSIVYRNFVKCVQNKYLHCSRKIYYNDIIQLTYAYFEKSIKDMNITFMFISEETFSKSNSYNRLFQKKIATMYNAYLFTHECIRFDPNIHLFSERIIRKLYQIIPDNADNTENTL